MLNPDSSCKIYLCTGQTDMRKGINGLSILAQSIISDNLSAGALFVFRGKRADKIKILWWDTQGFCLYYKCLTHYELMTLETCPKTTADF